MTHYEALGVSSSATDQEVRDAFHAIASRTHPDKWPKRMTPKAAVKLSAEWQAAQAAYNAIKTPKRRAAYDKEIALLAKPCLFCDGKSFTQTRTGFRVTNTECKACKGTGKVRA